MGYPDAAARSWLLIRTTVLAVSLFPSWCPSGYLTPHITSLKCQCPVYVRERHPHKPSWGWQLEGTAPAGEVLTLPCFPPHSSQSPAELSCTIFPATTSVFLGIPRHWQCFIWHESSRALYFICAMSGTSPLGWVGGRNSDQLYWGCARISHHMMTEGWKQIISKYFQRSQYRHQNKMLEHQCPAAWKNFCSVWRIALFFPYFNSILYQPIYQTIQDFWVCSSPFII